MTAPTPEDVEQLAASLAMSPTIGNADRLRIVDLLHLLARLLRGRVKSRYPPDRSCSVAT